MTTMDTTTQKSNGQLENQRSAREEAPTHFMVPAPVFAAVRQVIGQLPHDQVGALCKALDECQGS